MKLFDRLWRSAPTCAHNNSTAVHSEIGHDAVRRYYWFCGKCGERVYINDWQRNADIHVSSPGRRAIIKLQNVPV
jgi:ribosomal protein S27AE